MMTMKRAANTASRGTVTTATLLFLLLAATHHTATEAAGITYQYTGFGSCRDINGNTYSNIQLTDVSATANDLSCGDSCDIFLSSSSGSSGTLRGFEWQLVDGFDRRCYCLFDAGSNVEAMALEFINGPMGGGGGATWKADNVGIGEIDTAVNVGIDSYCYKLDPRVTPSTPLSDSPPTPLPTGWWTLPPLPVEPPTPPPVVVRPTPPPTDWWTETSVPLPTQPPAVGPPPTEPPVVGPPPTLPPQTIEEIFQGIFGNDTNSSEQVFTTSQVNDDPYEYDYDDADALNNNNKPTSQNNGWSSSTDDGWSSSTSHSSSTGHHVMGKSSKSSTSSSSKSSKSGQGLIEGKSDKDDSSLMRLEQMRYKVNGGRGRGGGGSVEMLLLVVTTMTVLSYLVW